MISFLKGRILSLSPSSLSVGIQAGLDSVVGYEVHVPLGQKPYCDWGVGQSVELQIHTHVREDALTLFGFSDVKEKQLFLSLLSVSGIGPKMAMQILSHWVAEDFIHAVIHEERALLSSTPGIGKKTAERLVVELRDSLKKRRETEAAVGVSRSIPRVIESGAWSEASQALLSLGYRDIQIAEVLKKLKAETVENGGSPPSTSELVKYALRGLAR